MKLLIGGSPCTHWSIAQTKNRETMEGYVMDAVKFIEERNRMCGTMSEVWGVDAAQIVKNTEEWSAAHPRKTRQSVFLEQYPEAEIDKCGCLMLCPKRISADCRNRYGNCTNRVCSDCRREFWMQEVE
jgi:hypothetical protein